MSGLEPARATALALRLGSERGIPGEVASDLPAALRQSDIGVTRTPSRRAPPPSSPTTARAGPVGARR